MVTNLIPTNVSGDMLTNASADWRSACWLTLKSLTVMIHVAVCWPMCWLPVGFLLTFSGLSKLACHPIDYASKSLFKFAVSELAVNNCCIQCHFVSWLDNVHEFWLPWPILLKYFSNMFWMTVVLFSWGNHQIGAANVLIIGICNRMGLRAIKD